ncbi:hypothetical protein [Aliirhizobium cellulosilyticum]|uniref:Uncharacterized protein n=1 Tax=Aliirhizobium cellulosilyticum TaxID=393664 RepID=A0A7W6XBZ9_9HYPH|nr:hypothetical protein [Rhizobium cellulosilyticum]MBB4349355.1 hypothetical protein [Rhizobium cellulosilyticum]MBB4412423.1 hypothetical protein [Rhizobium cellulosilyticum]MBB4447055.1 hypothetical protein [Rhizobium cellulosilyticum]
MYTELTLPQVLSDPLIHMVRKADGVSIDEFRSILLSAAVRLAGYAQYSEEPKFCYATFLGQKVCGAIAFDEPVSGPKAPEALYA